jgi:uncharacterized protein with NRDE domain
MCLILLGYKVSQQYPLVIAANRDEFFLRPTQPMHAWETAPFMVAGKDLEQGGTWFGVHKNGTFAALTNFRDPIAVRQDAPSRGEIIVDLLESGQPALTYFKKFQKKAQAYNGFNLIFGDPENLFWYSNKKNTIETIAPGIHGLSNKFLDTPWPKVESGKRALERQIRSFVTTGSSRTPESLFSILKDRTFPDDNLLPDTGVGLEWERILSPLFIQSPTYGTRSSTVMLRDQQGKITVIERTWNPEDRLNFSDQKFSITP